MTRRGAPFCCGTIPSVLDVAGFGSALALMVARGQIELLRCREIPIYEPWAEHDHKDDRRLVILFPKR